MIEVWHATNPTFGMTTPSWPGEFEHVADVATGSLDYAFERTNHIDRSWTENADVTVKRTRARSTSVGDVLVKDGVAFRCAAIGWEKV